jgi:AcrR family transcriptional regulator
MPRSYTTTNRQLASDQTRAVLAHSAWTVLANSELPSAFSMQAIATHAQVSRATAFNLLGSKAGAVAAAFEHFAVANGMDDLSTALSLPNLDKATLAYCKAFTRFYAQHRLPIQRLRAFAALDPTIAAVVAQREQRRREGLRHLLLRNAHAHSVALPRKAEQHTVLALAALFSFEAVTLLLDGAGPSQATRLLAHMVQVQIDAALNLKSGHH